MTAWERRMQAELLAIARQFTAYADHHRQKDPPDPNKAAANDMHAERARLAATEPESGAEP